MVPVFRSIFLLALFVGISMLLDPDIPENPVFPAEENNLVQENRLPPVRVDTVQSLHRQQVEIRYQLQAWDRKLVYGKTDERLQLESDLRQVTRKLKEHPQRPTD